MEPFEPGVLPGEPRIFACVERVGRDISAVFELSGRAANLLTAGKARQPERRDGLWQNTCFEIFIGPSGLPNYWEFNVSPSGHWNVYRFDDYRRGMRKEAAFSALPSRVLSKPDYFSLSIRFELETILPPAASLDAAISAVLKSSDATLSYWALVHRGLKPDFHDRSSFIITL
ncbi:MAG: DOMON-like domain-containing protein [Syntrophobacteraceae bacterium]